MRAFVRRPLALAVTSLTILLASSVLAQTGEAPGGDGKTLDEYRAELDRARDEAFRLFNEANEGNGTDVTCKDEQPTGSRMRQNVCRSAAENRADAAAARNFLLSRSSSTSNSSSMDNALVIASSHADAQVGSTEGLTEFERQWNRLLEEDPQFFRAVTTYVELENQYNRLRGVTDPAVRAAGANGSQCETTTLTEYQQRSNVARVSGTVSIAACPAGTTGSFTLVARVRDDNGEIRPIEFSETWQRGAAGDHAFNADYPIGDNVELMSVRVRNLKCTCAERVP
jgi:hypothetical protein